MDGRFDDLLLGLAQKHNGIEDLLYTIMSFYERRTDLFHVKDTPDDKKGFKAGQAEDMLRNQFHMFQSRYAERAQPHLTAQRPGSGKATPSITGAAMSSSSAAASPSPSSLPAPSPAGTGEIQAGAEVGAGPPRPGPEPKVGTGGRMASIPDGVNASPLDGGDPGAWERDQKQDSSGCRWNQSVTEVNVELRVEKCTKQDVKVVLASRKVCVKRKGEVVLEGDLHDKINCEESTWHLEDGKQVVLSLEKIRPMFWHGLFAA